MQQKLLSCAQLCSLTSVLSLFSLSLSFPLSRCVSNTQVEWTQKFVGDFGAQRLLTFSTWLAAFCFDFTAAACSFPSLSLSLSLHLAHSLARLAHMFCLCYVCQLGSPRTSFAGMTMTHRGFYTQIHTNTRTHIHLSCLPWGLPLGQVVARLHSQLAQPCGHLYLGLFYEYLPDTWAAIRPSSGSATGLAWLAGSHRRRQNLSALSSADRSLPRRRDKPNLCATNGVAGTSNCLGPTRRSQLDKRRKKSESGSARCQGRRQPSRT